MIHLLSGMGKALAPDLMNYNLGTNLCLKIMANPCLRLFEIDDNHPLKPRLSIINDANCISIEKSRFCMRELRYLDYIVFEKGIRPDPSKLKSIRY